MAIAAPNAHGVPMFTKPWNSKLESKIFKSMKMKYMFLCMYVFPIPLEWTTATICYCIDGGGFLDRWSIISYLQRNLIPEIEPNLQTSNEYLNWNPQRIAAIDKY